MTVTNFSRAHITQFLCLLALLLSVGAARPAQAAVAISSLTVNQNPLPSVGGVVIVTIDCANATGTPTGSATISNTSGTVLSQDYCGLYGQDAGGNPILYTYLVVPTNYSTTTGAAYTITATVTDPQGSQSVQSVTLPQGYSVPLTIDSVTATPGSLAATDTSVAVGVGLTCNGPNQSGFFKGTATLTNSAGALLDYQPLSGPSGTDSGGNPLYGVTLSHIPVNTSSSAQSYTIAMMVQDNLGIRSTTTTTVSQSAGGASAAPTSLTLPNVTGVVNQPVTLSATLTRADNSASLNGKTISFQVDTTPVGTAVTNAAGLACSPARCQMGTRPAVTA